MKRFFNRNILTGTVLILAFLLFLSINVSSSIFFKSIRLDLTKNRIYTLSDGTKEIIDDLQEPITIRFYFSKKLPGINPYIISFAKRVEDLLLQYQKYAKEKINIEIIDPEPFSIEEDEAVNYGLQGVALDSAGAEFYLGIVATDTLTYKQIIPFLQPAREINLEYDISQLIHKLSVQKPQTIGVMSSLPLKGSYTDRPWAIWQQMEQAFELQSIDLNEPLISENIQTLMVVEPSTFSTDALAAIDDFIMRGGHVLAFVDPVVEVTSKKDILLHNKNLQKAGDYKALLHSWGINFDESLVVADKNLAKTVRAPVDGREVSIRFPLWMDFTVENFNTNDILSSSLERLTVATPGALKHTIDSTTSFQALVTTSTDAMLLPSYKVEKYQQDIQQLYNDYNAQKQYVIGARIRGPIKSIYTDKTINDSNIIVFADSDMLHDHFWMQAQNIMGQEFSVPSASNGNLVLSALDNLLGSNALISIRNRAGFSKPFDTIKKFENDSMQKYHEMEQMLQQKLLVAKQNLETLEHKKGEAGNISTAIAQRTAEEKFRSQLIEIRRELRDVRRQLNQDIERVAANVKLFSIGLVPFLVMILGLLVWFVHRRQINIVRMHDAYN